MAVLTVNIKSTPCKRDEAIYLIIDDINKENYDMINNIVEKSDVVIEHKLSNPCIDEDLNIKSSISKEVEDVLNDKALIGLNETQIRNIKIKFTHWFKNELKVISNCLDNNKEIISSVFKIEKISKHEWLMFNLLNKLGVNVIVITKDETNISFRSEKAQILKYNTNENLALKYENANNINDNEKTIINIELDDIENDKILDILDDNNKIVKCIINGCTENIDNSLLALKIRNRFKDKSKLAFFDKKIDKPGLDETSKIYKLNKNDTNYIIETTKLFISCKNKELEQSIKEIFVLEMKKLVNKNNITNAQIIYNKAVTIICWFNRYLDKNINKFVYYGVPSNDIEIMFLKMLFQLNDISVVILSNKENNTLDNFAKDIQFIKLNMFSEDKRLDEISENVVKTMAYNMSKHVDEILYNDTLGMYKEGQIKTCNTKHLACTFDEINLIWNKDMDIRPGFSKNGDSVELPVIFGIVRGVKDGTDNYIDFVQKYAYGKTLLYKHNRFAPEANDNGINVRHLAIINGTSFVEQNALIVNGKLQTELIKKSKNYKYGFLDVSKQNLILSKIQELIEDNTILTPAQYIGGTKELNEYYDLLLNITLNLDNSVLKLIQWFNFVDYNPNVIVTSVNESVLTFADTLYLKFLSKLGFDVLIFVPTKYISVEEYIKETEYEDYDIGRVIYNIDTKNLSIKENIETNNKKGFFGRFFK